ncbi:unnamed protein product [Diatraea saccharalis]|uniref:Uncharacterized protein n=1 Tax=Diatraea saccharalis TaxID=40085 RepID=A0A9N9QWR9_9NEOP|nr:unnamed protein product [Diatraea saccharalis]
MEKFDTSCEPMDVDLSTTSVNTSSSHDEATVSENPSPALNTANTSTTTAPSEIWTVKTYHIKKTEKNNGHFKLFVTLLVLCASIIIYMILDIKCIDSINLTELRTVFETRVHDQTKAVELFLDSLSQDVDSKIIFLYGATGVGKTYTTSLLLENIWNSSNIYHFTMPSFINTFSVDTMYGINICKTSTIVVDDLKESDLLTVKKFMLDIITKSEDLKKKVTIILIINCDIITKELIKSCDEHFYETLTESFNDVHVTKKFIKYEPLTLNTLRKCINDVLGDQKISNNEYNNLLNNFNVTLDGCKGVYKKVKILKKFKV